MESVSLTSTVTALLDAAKTAKAGRSAQTLHGTGAHLRHTVIALAEGQQLAEHESPGEATLQVLHGEVAMRAGQDEWRGSVGDLLTIPPQRHDLLALGDAVVLLTVVIGQD